MVAVVAALVLFQLLLQRPRFGKEKYERLREGLRALNLLITKVSEASQKELLKDIPGLKLGEFSKDRVYWGR